MRRAVDNGKLRASTLQASTDFILIELELAKTFCQIANTTSHADTASRNIDNAERAYQTAVSALQKLSSKGQPYPREIDAKLDEVAGMIGAHPDAH